MRAARYAELARLAYVVLPPQLDWHRRVLLAHAAVQYAESGGTGHLRGLRRHGGRGAAKPVAPPEAAQGGGSVGLPDRPAATPSGDGAAVAVSDSGMRRADDGGADAWGVRAEPPTGGGSTLTDGLTDSAAASEDARLRRRVLAEALRARPRRLLLPRVWGLRLLPDGAGAGAALAGTVALSDPGTPSLAEATWAAGAVGAVRAPGTAGASGAVPASGAAGASGAVPASGAAGASGAGRAPAAGVGELPTSVPAQRVGGSDGRVAAADAPSTPPPQADAVAARRAVSATAGALAVALGALSAPERAAYALLALEGLDPRQAQAELVRLDAAAPGAAVARAQSFAAVYPGALLHAPDFDPSLLRAGTTDLRRRSRRGWWAAAACAAVCAGAVALGAVLAGTGPGGADNSAAASANPAATGPESALTAPTAASLVRVSANAWRSTERMDFSAWPARGGATADADLIDRALRAWTAQVPSVGYERPQLLWAGEADQAEVVLLTDGHQLARYTLLDHPPVGDSGAELSLSRTEDADVTTAGGVLLRSGPQGDRFLLAPWVQQVQQRDLAHPDTPAQPLAVKDGLTAAVPSPPAQGCTLWPVLQLRSSTVIAEHHAFLLTELGGPGLVHLTYTPPPSVGPAQSPREATGGPALVAWARLACALPTLRGQGVAAVNAWEFAQQQLPEAAGTASWVCLRADQWTGGGSAETLFLPPAVEPNTPAQLTARQAQGRACGRFSQNDVGATLWHAPSGTDYVLAAGSRHVNALKLPGGSWTPGTTLAAPTRRSTQPTGAQAKLDTGGTVSTLR